MKDRRWIVATVVVAVAAVAAVVAFLATREEGEDERPAAPATPAGRAIAAPPGVRPGSLIPSAVGNRRGSAPAAAGASVSSDPDQGASITRMFRAQSDMRAYPRRSIDPTRTRSSRLAFAALPRPLSPSAGGVDSQWQQLGAGSTKAKPFPFWGYPVRPIFVSGRVLAIAPTSRCVPGSCRLYVGTGGGGIWRTDDALAAKPSWRSVSRGITSAAVAALAVDPSDPSGNTVYAGTGEEYSGHDSSIGTGVFKTTDGGESWQLLPGSPEFVEQRAVVGVIVHPKKPKTLWVATSITLHGASSVEGGQAVPPRGRTYGLYRSDDGGTTFRLEHSEQLPGTSVSRPPTQIALDPNDPDTIYLSLWGLGILRQSPKLDGDRKFRRVFASLNDSAQSQSRTYFALAKMGSKTRIYAGDADPFAAFGPEERGLAYLLRLDNARVPAAKLVRGGNNTALWKNLSSKNPAKPGYDSFRYCGGSCTYSNYVGSPPGRPDQVYLGQTFSYADAAVGASNSRMVVRSADAGVSFTDMSLDARTPPLAMHPDQHTIAFSPTNPDIAFMGGDGGIARSSGRFVDARAKCAGRGLAPSDLTRCKRLLRAIPTRIFDMNEGLATLLFHSVTASPNEEAAEIIGGTQDNGTWAYSPSGGWEQIAGGDGGQSAIDAEDPNIRVHTNFERFVHVNYSKNDPSGWRGIWHRLYSSGERTSFYMPLVGDPKVPGTLFTGLQHVWRTKNYGGARQVIVRQCRVDNLPEICGKSWEPIGPDLTDAALGVDKADESDIVVAVERTTADTSTLWAATLSGRVFVSTNADAAAPAVKFVRIDRRAAGGKKATPGRFVSGIAIDPADANHAWVSFSGYSAHTPADEPGHVFEVRFNPQTRTATWENRSFDIGDQPVADIAFHAATGDLYAASDFGVMRLRSGGKTWAEAAKGLPLTAVYGLTLSKSGKTLYAATHGRGVWKLEL